jgi:hypothetical protein
MTDTTMRGGFDMGRVVSRTFGAVGQNFVVFLGLSLLLSALPGFIWQMLIWSMGQGTAIAGLLAIPGFLFLFVSAYVLQAALVSGAVSFLNGRPAAFGPSLAIGFRSFLSLLLLAILMGLGEMLGFIALLVPGLILMTMWAVAIPVLVVERKSANEAMRRSRILTKGSRWAIFGLLVVFGIAAYLISLIGLAVTGGLSGVLAAGRITSPLAIGVQAIISAFTTMIGAAGVSAMYFELRGAREGAGSSELAAVFD